MVNQGKRGGYMQIPPPRRVRYTGHYFDQSLGQSLRRPLHFFTPDIELSDHIEEIVSLANSLVFITPALAGRNFFCDRQGELRAARICRVPIALGSLAPACGWLDLSVLH
jgi:hypothetical protein